MAKAIGTEIIDFYENGWPEGYYVDESELDVLDGKIINREDDKSETPLPLTDKYDLDRFGMICQEGNGYDNHPFSYFFNKWKKAKSTMSLVIEFDRSREAMIRAALKLNNVKIVN